MDSGIDTGNKDICFKARRYQTLIPETGGNALELECFEGSHQKQKDLQKVFALELECIELRHEKQGKLL